MEYYALTTKTPVGVFSMIVESNPTGDLVIVSGFEDVEGLKNKLPAELRLKKIAKGSRAHEYVQIISRYFAGEFGVLKIIPKKQLGTAFQESVWKKIASIQPGKTSSYLSIAKTVGSPRSARAVGTSCGKNKLVLLVPCHRVIKGDGTLGGYVYGNKIKSALLDLEQHKLKTKL